MNVYAYTYCPHCYPSGIVSVASSKYAPPLARVYCERYWKLVSEQLECNRNETMWQEQC